MSDDRKTIKVNNTLYNQLMEIKTIHNYRSVSETIKNVIPDGTITNTDYESEPPAFTIKDNIVSWTVLKKAEIGMKWCSKDGSEEATILYKDEYGALLRFKYNEEFYINYFHYLE